MRNVLFHHLLGTERIEKLISVAFQCRPAGDGKLDLRDRFAITECFVDTHQAGGFEAARVGAEIAVGQTGAASQVHEFHAMFDGQCGENLEPAAAGNQRVVLLGRGHELIIGLLAVGPSHELIS